MLIPSAQLETYMADFNDSDDPDIFLGKIRAPCAELLLSIIMFSQCEMAHEYAYRPVSDDCYTSHDGNYKRLQEPPSSCTSGKLLIPHSIHKIIKKYTGV